MDLVKNSTMSLIPILLVSFLLIAFAVSKRNHYLKVSLTIISNYFVELNLISKSRMLFTRPRNMGVEYQSPSSVLSLFLNLTAKIQSLYNFDRSNQFTTSPWVSVEELFPRRVHCSNISRSSQIKNSVRPHYHRSQLLIPHTGTESHDDQP